MTDPETGASRPTGIDHKATLLSTLIGLWPYIWPADRRDLKGRVLSGVLGTVGKRVLRKAFSHSVTAIEARNAVNAT